jgi:hypothetical protein
MNVKVPQSGSLEEQRDALLARIHASRAAYREQMHVVDAGAPAPTMKQLMHDPQAHPFPRSLTMRWLLSHPGVAVGGVALVVLLGPRRTINGIAKIGPIISGAASMVTMTLQDPAKMRVAARGVSMLTDMIRSRR